MLAGLSSRFQGRAKGLTKIGPNNETLLEYSLNQAIKKPFSKIIFIVSKKTEQMYKEHFGNRYKGIPIIYALQKFNEQTREKPWGTTDALCSAKDLINEPFIVCNGDDIYGGGAFEKIFNHLNENETDVSIGYKLGKVLPEEGSANRGIFEFDKNENIKTITENIGISFKNLREKSLTPDSPCSMNIFGLNLNTLKLLCEELEKFKEENKGDSKIECYLPKELGKLISENKITMKFYPTEEKWFGLTNPEDERVVKESLKSKNL